MGRGAMHLFARLLSAAALAGSLFVCAFGSDSALAEKRVALVVGDSNYQNVPQLPNPAADARSIADLLTRVGFQVDLEIDVGNLAFKRAIRRFEDAAAGSDMAIVYFAGHGFEMHGINYLIPVDARLADERDAPDEAIALDRLLEAVSPARRLALIMVDACRDNPFLVTMKRLTVSRSLVRGLARVEPEGTDTLIAYAAKDGSTAEDGHGAHSPFTTALLDNLTIPGLDVQLAFRRVRDEVLKITDGRQEPYVYGSLGGKVISLVPGPDQTNQASGSDIRQDFQLAQQIGTAEAWAAFLNTYKTGFYAELAKAALAKLNDQTQNGNSQQIARLEVPAAPSKVPTPTDDALAWDRIKDSNNQAALEDFIARFPDSPLAANAQHILQNLKLIAKEREAEQAQKEWDKIKNSNDQAAISAFIARYRDTPLAVTAQERLTAIQQAAKAQDEKAKSEWAKLKSSNDQAALNSFIARYPNSPLLENARQRLASLEQAAKALADKAAAEWAKLRDSDDPSALQAFIARYPRLPVALDAQERLAAVQQAAKAQDELARTEWNKIKDSSDQAALQSFIASFPKSTLISSAKDRLIQLQHAAQEDEKRARAEWAKIKRSSDLSELQAFIEHFPNSPLAASAKERVTAVQEIASAEQKARSEWDKIKGSSDPTVLQSFISSYPRSQVAADAQKRLDEVQRSAKAAAEKAAADWAKLSDSNDQAALEAFVARYPNSSLAANAKTRLRTLESIAKAQDEAAKSVWARIQNSSEPGDFQAFIANYPRSPQVANAQQRLTALKEISAANASAKAPQSGSPAASGQAYSMASAERQPAPDAAMPSQSVGGPPDQHKNAVVATGTAAQHPSAADQKVTMLESPPAPKSAPAGLTDEQRAWEQIKDSDDEAALESFIARYPDSPLSLNAKQRLDILKQAKREREQQKSRPAAASNTPDLVRAAQVELQRLGCFSGNADGKLTAATWEGVSRYLSQRNGEDSAVAITDGFVTKLRNEHARVCPLVCGQGETAHGDTCVANKPTKQDETVQRKEEESHHKSRETRRRDEEERPRRRADRGHAAPRPHVREEVSAGRTSHGGGGGGGTTTGVGF
jgi:outer membrane protein assembly factor BamD (BamD/ComL family)